MNLLHIDSSITGANSVSRRLGARVVARLRARHPGIAVTYRDLAADPVPHHTAEILAAKATGAAGPDDQAAFSDIMGALEAFIAADIVVIGVPMYNFGIPSQLKAWMDCLAVAGRTFRYSSAGTEGLAGDKRLIIASARGNAYSDGPAAVMDHQETYLRTFFGFLGITDITFVRAEGVMLGAEVMTKAIDGALATADAL